MLNDHINYAEPPDEDNEYWLSFSDILAGLLVIFVLASVALMLEISSQNQSVEQAIAEAVKDDQVRSEIITQVVDTLNADSIRVEIAENHTVIRIPEDVITFEKGEFRVPQDPQSQRNALQVGRVIADVLAQGDRFKHLDTVYIEGHTDSTPYYNPAMKGNWGLSTFRAIEVWNLWHDAGTGLDAFKNASGKKLFSVSGFGATRPDPATLAHPDTPASMRKNRRIDIRFTIRRPDLQKYNTLASTLR